MDGTFAFHPKHSTHPIHPSSDIPLHLQTCGCGGYGSGVGEIIMRSTDTIILIQPAPSHQTFIESLNPYYGLIGTILTVFVAWAAITRKIRFSTLHENRARVIEEMHARVVKLRAVLRPLLYDWRDREDLNKDLSKVHIALNKFEKCKLYKGIYFSAPINRLLDLIYTNVVVLWGDISRAAITFEIRDGDLVDLGDEEIKIKITEAREKYELIIKETLPDLETRLKREFQKVLGIEPWDKPLIHKMKTFLSSAFRKFRKKSLS